MLIDLLRLYVERMIFLWDYFSFVAYKWAHNGKIYDFLIEWKTIKKFKKNSRYDAEWKISTEKTIKAKNPSKCWTIFYINILNVEF